MREFKDVVNKLNEFTCPDDVAAHFEEHGVQAFPLSAHSCAVSEYVKSQTEVGEVCTSFAWVDLSIGGKPRAYVRDSGTGEKITLSEVCRQFIKKFDNEGYPNLVKKEDFDA